MSFSICVIGCGNMAVNGHGPAYQRYRRLHPDTVLAGCCDLNEAAAERFRQSFGFERAYTDYRRMLREQKPDVVCVITAVEATAAISADVLASGYPVLLEKPPGLEPKDTRRIADAARRGGVPARAAFNRRYMPLVRALKRELAQIPDPVLHVEYQFVRVGRTDSDFSTTAIHAIDTAGFLAESGYRTVDFQYQDVAYADKSCMNTNMACRFASGATGTITLMACGGCVIERAIVTKKDYTFFLELPVWNGLDAPGSLRWAHKGRIVGTICAKEVSDGDDMVITNGFYGENQLFFDELRSGEGVVQDIDGCVQSVDIAAHMRRREEHYQNNGP